MIIIQCRIGKPQGRDVVVDDIVRRIEYGCGPDNESARFGAGQDIVFQKQRIGACRDIDKTTGRFFVDKRVITNPEVVRYGVGQPFQSITQQVAVGGIGALFYDISYKDRGAAVGQIDGPAVLALFV